MGIYFHQSALMRMRRDLINGTSVQWDKLREAVIKVVGEDFFSILRPHGC